MNGSGAGLCLTTLFPGRSWWVWIGAVRMPGGVMHVGIVGSGKIGSTLAKLWIDAGHEVLLSSRHPAELQPLARKAGPAGGGSNAARSCGVRRRHAARGSDQGCSWVKGFNTVNYKVLESRAHDGEERVGVPIASDDGEGLDVASRLIRDARF